MSYTYTCYECRGTFEGRGVFPPGNDLVAQCPHCPQCVLIKQQQHQHKEQSEAADRRYWDEVDRRERYRPAQSNSALHNLADILAKHVEKVIDNKLKDAKPENKNRCQPGVIWPEEKKPALTFVEEQRIASVYERYLERERLKSLQNPSSD